MKMIKEEDFMPHMGVLIDVRDPVSFKEHHNIYSKNIYYDTLLMNHKTLLNKNTKYFLICDKGHKSKQAVRILAFYGYDVTFVINK